MIENVDVPFFRRVLELEGKTYEDFLNFVFEIINLKDVITYDDFLIFRASIFAKIASNDYNFLNIDNVIMERISNSFNATTLKLYSYMKYLADNKKIYLEDKVDVLKYYGDIKNIDKKICAYDNIENLDFVNLEDVLNYIMEIGRKGNKDDIALSIILNIVSLEEAEKYYEQLIEKLKNFCVKYKAIIKELNHKKLIKELFDYLLLSKFDDKIKMLCQMIEYLKNNNLKKDKIYTVLKKVEELRINRLNINIGVQIRSEIYSVQLTKFQEVCHYENNGKGEKREENRYGGTYIYTDGVKNWLIKTASANRQNNFEDTYKIKVKDFKYVLFNHKMVDDENLFGPRFHIISKLQIYDFDMDISTLPSYEELQSFKVPPQIDFIQVEEKNKAVDTILQIERTIKDVNKILNKLTKLQEKLQIIKDSNEYANVFSQIESLENLIEQMEAMKSKTYDEYLKQGITELEKLTILKKLSKKMNVL